MDQETTDKKWYRPTLEDFRVGYEFYDSYGKKCVLGNPGRLAENEWTLDQVVNNLSFNYIRVNYLTKEDIQAEGWELENYHLFIMDSGDEKKDQTYWKLKKGSVHLMFYEQSHEIRLYKIDFSRETTRESGFKDDFRVTFKCPSINEFRYICKLLEI